MLSECARENDIFLFQHIRNSFPYPGFSYRRYRYDRDCLPAMLLAATKALSYDFIYFFMENFGEDMKADEINKSFEAMGRMSQFDLFAKVTQYFRFEVEGQNPLAVYFLKGYFCTPDTEFSRDMAREFIAEYFTCQPQSLFLLEGSQLSRRSHLASNLWKMLSVSLSVTVGEKPTPLLLLQSSTMLIESLSSFSRRETFDHSASVRGLSMRCSERMWS